MAESPQSNSETRKILLYCQLCEKIDSALELSTGLSNGNCDRCGDQMKRIGWITTNEHYEDLY